MTTMQVFLLLGLIAMLGSPGADDKNAAFAFGIGMALPGIWEFQKAILEHFRRKP